MGSYRERLLVPVSYWLLSAPTGVVLGAEAYFFVDGWIPILVICLLMAVVAVFLLHWSGAVIEVTGGVLRAGPESIALSETADVVALDERQSAALRGPRADPTAVILLRPYLRRAVYVELADPGAGAPYWLVATRRPEELAAAIMAARGAGEQRPGDRESVG